MQRHWVWMLLLVALTALAGCGGAAESDAAAAGGSGSLHVLGGTETAGQGSNPVVLEWSETMTNFSAFARTLVVREDGTLHFEQVGSGATTIEGAAPAEVWTRTLAVVRSNDVCGLRGSGEVEHEDQTPTLVLAVPGAQCRVMLSDAEWATDARARRVRDAVSELFPVALGSE